MIPQLPMLRLLRGFIQEQYSLDFARPHYFDNTIRKDQVFAERLMSVNLENAGVQYRFCPRQ